MTDSIDFNKVYAVALKFLAHKPRTEEEVRHKLIRYLSKYSTANDDGIAVENTPEIVEVINALKAEKFLNDKEYVQSYLDYQAKSQKKSALHLKKFLLNKGVKRELITDTLHEIGFVEKDAIKAQAQKKLLILSTKKLPPAKLKQRLITYLLGKAFKPEDVFDTVDSLLGVK